MSREFGTLYYVDTKGAKQHYYYFLVKQKALILHIRACI